MDMYNLVKNTIDDLKIGNSISIKTPVNLRYFRKYLSEISRREGKKFTTKKTENGKLIIFRVKYSNIYSKEVE